MNRTWSKKETNRTKILINFYTKKEKIKFLNFINR